MCITKESLRPLFLGKSASEFYPIDWAQEDNIQLESVGQEIHFLYYDTLGEKVNLVYDILHDRWEKFLTEDYATAVYGDENQSQYKMLLATKSGVVLTMVQDIYDDDGDAVLETTPFPVPVNFRTGAIDFGVPLSEKEFGSLMIDADTHGTPVTVTPLYESEQEVGDNISLVTSQRETKTFSLGNVYRKNLSLDFAWEGLATIYQVVIQHRIADAIRSCATNNSYSAPPRGIGRR